MLDSPSARPEEMLHVSRSLRYDLIAAHDLGIHDKVYVNRSYAPSAPSYGYHEMTDLSGLPPLLGL
jgi:2-haloacid dehalogenase